jgi:hypothetical protein
MQNARADLIGAVGGKDEKAKSSESGNASFVSP